MKVQGSLIFLRAIKTVTKRALSSYRCSLYLVACEAINTRKLLVGIVGTNPEVSLNGFYQRKPETKAKAIIGIANLSPLE